MVSERMQAVTTERGGDVVPLQAAVVTGDYFSTLGVVAAFGRLFVYLPLAQNYQSSVVV
jgi:hypothetical protein